MALACIKSGSGIMYIRSGNGIMRMGNKGEASCRYTRNGSDIVQELEVDLCLIIVTRMVDVMHVKYSILHGQ